MLPTWNAASAQQQLSPRAVPDARLQMLQTRSHSRCAAACQPVHCRPDTSTAQVRCEQLQTRKCLKTDRSLHTAPGCGGSPQKSGLPLPGCCPPAPPAPPAARWIRSAPCQRSRWHTPHHCRGTARAVTTWTLLIRLPSIKCGKTPSGAPWHDSATHDSVSIYGGRSAARHCHSRAACYAQRSLPDSGCQASCCWQDSGLLPGSS